MCTTFSYCKREKNAGTAGYEASRSLFSEGLEPETVVKRE